MIHVYFYYGKNSELKRFYAEGHSRYRIKSLEYRILKLFGKKPSGSDIVCAAVSALLYTLVLGLDKVLKVNLKLKIKENGLLDCSIKSYSPQKKEKIDIIVDTIKRGLLEIKKEYSSEIEITEVKNGT